MTPPSNRATWMAVSAMFILNGALYGIWASRIPAMAVRHDLDAGALGLLLLLLAGGAIAAFPLAGRFADRFGAAMITLRIAVAYTVALALTALAPNVASLAFALMIFGATHGAMDVAMNTWAGEAERHIARPVMSSFHAMFSLGAGLGAASGFAAEHWGVGIPLHFIVTGAGVAVVTLAFARIGWVSPTRDSLSDTPLFPLPKGPLIAVGLIAFCTSMGEGAMVDWSALLLIETAGVTAAHAALGYSVFSVAMVITRLLGDQATRAFGPTPTARVAGVIATLGAVSAVASTSYGVTLVGFALMGIGYAVIMPLAFSRAARDPHLPPGTAIASVSTLGYGGLLLGPPLIGFVAHATTLRTGFGLLAVLAALIVVLAGAVRARKD
ncbi:MFS transporter [uncultured Tateyamaria sp.]|uniref:MFS transporter n=1 Tax=uncultured Tateyamaria sp. TaxID=455651 RepID=UPI002631D911|nr:MFS transporter [uncultured Tateyamaria sp.]